MKGKKRSKLDRAITIFLCLFIFFIIIGFSVLAGIIMGSKLGEDALGSLTGKNGNSVTEVTVKTHPNSFYEFDGSSYIQSSTVLDIYTQTISLWFRLTKLDILGKRTIFSNRDYSCKLSPYGDSNTNGYAVYIDVISPQERNLVLLINNEDGPCQTVSSPLKDDVSKWTHIAVVFKRMNKNSKSYRFPVMIDLYVNGKMQKSIETSRQLQNSIPFFVGAFFNKRYPFIGCISSIKIYETALSSNSIAELSHYVNSKQNERFAKYYVKLRDESVSERIGEVTHLLQISMINEIIAYDKDDVEEEAREKFVESNPDSVESRDEKDEDEEEENIIVDNSKRVKSRLRNGKSDLELFKSSLHSKDIKMLKSGVYHFSIPLTVKEKYDKLNSIRSENVKKSMQFLWKNYELYAFGHDELKPQNGDYDDNWTGVGMTLVDSLDTLYIMGMRAEFNRAVEWVVSSLSFSSSLAVSVFEFNIRLLGGLLSAYDLSKDQRLLTKSQEIGDILLSAFDSKYKLPASHIIPHDRRPVDNGRVMLAEYGTLSLEFRYLSYHTMNDTYKRKIDELYRYIRTLNTTDGLLPLIISLNVI